MKAFREYWTFSAIRGALTLVMSVGILALPYVTSVALSIPVLIALAIDLWAVYSIFDGAVVLLLAVLLPERTKSSTGLMWQALANVCVGGALFLIVYGVLDLRWTIAVATFQAGFAAVVEFTVARATHGEYGCLSCYSTAIALAVSAVALPLALGFDRANAPLAIATYVGLYGTCELTLGGRMLFVEYRAEHPAAVASQAWRLEMRPLTQPPAVAFPRTLGLDGEVAELIDRAHAA